MIVKEKITKTAPVNLGHITGLFADTERLLEQFRIFATPCCVVKKVSIHHGKWDISKIKFPVALYDKHDELHTADSVTKLNEILKTFHSPATVLIYEVPQGSGFVWFHFEWGQIPRLVNATGIDTLPLDVDMYDRVTKTWRNLFRELPKMRLQFAVSHDKTFMLMSGVYMN